MREREGGRERRGKEVKKEIEKGRENEKRVTVQQSEHPYLIQIGARFKLVPPIHMIECNKKDSFATR